MNRPIQLNTGTLPVRNLINRSPLHRVFPVVLLVLSFALFAFPQAAQAVSPAPDGGYANGNTAEGTNALFSLTTGADNTANGFNALFSNTTGDLNTAVGWNALSNNTSGIWNTAAGVQALLHNTTGNYNTATGVDALYFRRF